jgi:hypothetical protein
MEDNFKPYQDALDAYRKDIEQVIAIGNRLIASASEAEARLDKMGIPVCSNNSWALHGDAVCQALWSQRHIAEKTLAELHAGTSIGAVQFFVTDEEKTPFQWLS